MADSFDFAPAFTLAVPMIVKPSLNVIVPEGVPPPATLSVVEMVIVCPNVFMPDATGVVTVDAAFVAVAP